jgi:NADH:ubiquinone oxidoreductase subunit 3 (subunit A)
MLKMMEGILFSPPVLFLMFAVIFLGCSKLLSSYSHAGSKAERKMDPYACGQRDIRNYVNPDYSQYFPLAFFFTIMHVLVLVVATAPYDAPILPVVYIGAGVLAMVIIFKR